MFRDQVFSAKFQTFILINRRRFGTGRGPRKLRNPLDTSDFHSVINRGCAYIQRPPEDEREAQHIVNLIGKIRAPCRNNRIGRHRPNFVRHDFRCRIGQRKHDRLRRHLGYHFRLQNPGTREAQKQIRPLDHILKRPHIAVLGKVGLLRRHLFGPALVDQPGDVTQPDIFAFHSQFQQHVKAGNPRRAATG